MVASQGRHPEGGDGRRDKERLVEHLLANAPKGDIQAAIKLIDEFGSKTSWLMNIGDEKGALLDDAVLRTQPKQALELGAFCGYSGLRIAQALPAGGKLLSIEMNPRNASISTRVWELGRRRPGHSRGRDYR